MDLTGPSEVAVLKLRDNGIHHRSREDIYYVLLFTLLCMEE